MTQWGTQHITKTHWLWVGIYSDNDLMPWQQATIWVTDDTDLCFSTLPHKVTMSKAHRWTCDQGSHWQSSINFHHTEALEAYNIHLTHQCLLRHITHLSAHWDPMRHVAYYKTSLMVSWHFFRQWLVAIRQRGIVWVSVDIDLCPCLHSASPSHNELISLMNLRSRLTLVNPDPKAEYH